MTLTDDIYSKGTLISTSTYNDTLERLNYDKERLSEYFNAVQGTRYHETFQVTGTYQKVFNLVSGTYKVGSNSIEVYVNKKQVTNFEETTENKVTLSDQVNAGSTVDIYYKNEPKYDPSEIDKMLNDYSSFIEQAKELTSTIQSIQDIWTNDITSKTASLIQDTLDKAVNSFNSKLDALSNDITTNNKTLTTNVQAAQSRINDLDTLYSNTSNTLKASFNSLQSIVDDIHDKVTNLVDPFDKSKDTIGGRNLLPGTSGTLQIVTNASGYTTNLPVLTPVVTKIDSDTTYTARAWISPASHNVNFQVVWQDSSGVIFYGVGNTISAGTSGYSTWTGTITAGSTVQRISVTFSPQQSTPSSVSYKEMKFEKGSIATDWTPAPEDKVNVTDMRKPASDVAGIDETVLDNHDNTITANSLTYDLSKTCLTPINALYSGSFNDLPLGTVFATNSMTDGPDKIHAFTTTTFYFKGWNPGRKSQIAIADSGNLMYFRAGSDLPRTSWVLLSDDSKVVHSTDMRKPASDVAGIEEVNAKQDKIGYTPADDSKVLHSTLTQLNSTDMDTVLTTGFYQSINGTNGIPSGDNWTIYQVIPLSTGRNGVQLACETNNIVLGMRSWNYTSSGINFSNWIQFADDSKVAHLTSNNTLSGTNNFTGPIQHNGNSVGARIQASNNDEDSAINDSAKGNSDDIYYWTED